MADRKLYHLVNGEFVHDGMPEVQIPTYAEIGARIAILNNIGFFDDPIAESVPAWDGLSNGKRTTEKQASVYDAMMAEIMGERNAEKAKVRNRRRADRKHNVLPKVRKQMRYDRGWNRYMSMPCYGCKNIGIAEYRMDNAEAVARKDWEIDLRDLEYDIAYVESSLEENNDDLEWLNNEIENIGNPDDTIAIYEKRLKVLRKESERKARLEQYKVDTEKYIRNNEEFLRKYNYVKEMI